MIFPFMTDSRISIFQESATLIIRHHLVLPQVDDVFRRLLQISTYHLEVRSLSSGRSGTISGEVSRNQFQGIAYPHYLQIALHPGPSTLNSPIKLIPRTSALQYQLTDTGPIFFERGTGAAVL